MMYRLHYAPDNASLCVRLALTLADLPFETVLVDRAAQGQRAAGYLALNPNGLIPVLETSGGPIFETAAILLWLADRHPEAGLFPRPEAAERGPALSWLLWLSNAAHPALRMIFYPDRMPPMDASAVAEAGRARVTALLDIAEAGLVPAPLLDCYLCPILRWPAVYPVGRTDWYDLARWPRLMARAAAFEALPAVAAACAAEGLGPQPFTSPVLPNPPEGSAT